jgi:S1-C subfamily serine protease
VVIDQSSVGFQHDAPLGAAWQGGPIVTVDGKVLGVASLSYAPLGFAPAEQVHFSVGVNEVCRKIVSCGNTRQAGPKN